MSEFKDFSSLPPDQEREFVVFERHAVQSGKKAKIIGLIASMTFLVLLMSVVFSQPPPENLMAHDDMGAFSAPAKKAEAPAAETPEAAAEGDGEAAAQGDGEADGEAEAEGDDDAE